MSAVIAVMLVVACEPDLLACQPVFHWHRSWATVAACRVDRARITERVSARYGGRMTVMTKCRLFLDERGDMPPPGNADTPALF